MSIRVVTISREFGSGGRTVGKLVADKLGYAFYDQQLILDVAKESGLSQDIVKKYGEYATHRNSFLYAISMSAGASYGGMSFVTQVQVAQSKVIRDLAIKGNCVIVGRCADYILRERDDCLHTFIHADVEFRSDRIVNLYGETEKKPEERLRDKDERRRLYYRSFTMRDWGACQNYHITLDSGVVGIEKCADIIASLAKPK